MCGLFGFSDTQHILTRRQVNRLAYALAVASETRGTDSTGIAYNNGGSLYIYKRPVRAKRFKFQLPEGVHTLTGHTRMTTQGNGTGHKNYNNHPFEGHCGGRSFALAHNGVLHNDEALRKERFLSQTRIETDSYIAVQLLERSGKVNHATLASMAESLMGSFCFTVLAENNTIYFVKGNNPLCLYHFEALGLYVYASTEDILRQAIRLTGFLHGRYTKLHIESGDILALCCDGTTSKNGFDTSLIDAASYHRYGYGQFYASPYAADEYSLFFDDLLSVAGSMGYSEDDICYLLESGFSEEDIEEMLYESMTAPVT